MEYNSKTKKVGMERGRSFSNTLSSNLERFVNYLKYTKNASLKTIENYSHWINRFIGYV
jgi:site-specific recombinase XerC